jgi:predicted alpha/beta superfamily hydrolase
MIAILLVTLACGPGSGVFQTDPDAEILEVSSKEDGADGVLMDVQGANNGTNPTSTGRFEEFTLSIPQLNNREREIQVYLPADYDTTEKIYPVIYILDGDFAFNPPRVDQGDYAIDETLDRLFAEGYIEGMIAVAIPLDFDYLWDEYTPWINPNMHDWVKPANSEPIEGGEGFEFLDFITHTLKPEIDARYRTKPDRENTLIGGFCRTAIVPVIAGLNYPDVYSKIITMSPTVWLAESGGQWLSNNQLINYINEISVPTDVKFFIHVGTEESSGNRPPIEDQYGKRITYARAYIEGAEILYQSMLDNGVPASNVHLEIIEGSAGGRDTWASRFDDALFWLLDLP